MDSMVGGVLEKLTAASESSALKAGRPMLSTARSGTSSFGNNLSADGMLASAFVPCISNARAIGSSATLAWNTPLMINRCCDKPSALSSTLVLSASFNALVSGLATNTTEVNSGLLKAASAWLNLVSCIFRPECGPKQEAPLSFPARKPLHALGRLNNLSVCPLGAVAPWWPARAVCPPSCAG